MKSKSTKFYRKPKCIKIGIFLSMTKISVQKTLLFVFRNEKILTFEKKIWQSLAKYKP